MNKKLILLSSLLVLALFIISACQDDAVGRRVLTAPIDNGDGNGGSGVTYQGVLDMLNNCDVYGTVSSNYSCTQICQNVEKTCVYAEINGNLKEGMMTYCDEVRQENACYCCALAS